MIRIFFIILSTIFFIRISEIKAQEPSPGISEKKNQFFLLAGAPAIYSGLSYERILLIKNKFTILPRAGFGLNIFRPSLGKEFDFHLGITGLYGRYHNLEIGFGTIHYLVNQSDISDMTHYYAYKFMIYGLAGYRYNFKRYPLSVKFGLTPVVISNFGRWVVFPFIETGLGFRI